MILSIDTFFLEYMYSIHFTIKIIASDTNEAMLILYCFFFILCFLFIRLIYFNFITLGCWQPGGVPPVQSHLTMGAIKTKYQN